MLTYKDIIHIPYYYVPPCPRCNSCITGRFVKQNSNTDYTFREGLKNGELIKPVVYDVEENAFCCDCGFTWPEFIEMKFLSLKSVEEEKRKRGTNAILQNEYEQMEVQKKEHKKKHPFLNLLTSFVGKI